MKKKVLALLLCAMMTASLIACGDEDGQSSQQGSNQGTGQESQQQQQEQEQPPQQEAVTPEALPDAFAHITFDEGVDEGYTVVVQVDDGSVAPPDGGPFAIVESSDVLGHADGPVGQALYLDGKHGLDLNLEATNTDTWSVSYWLNGDRFGTYGPTLCMGYNIGRAADAGNNVTWFSITQTEWGADNGQIFPVVWSRNEASNAQDGTVCWPWMAAFDDAVHGKKEWVMITLVSSGEKQDGPEGITTCGAQLYINGQLVYDSADNYTNHTYWDEYTWSASLAPNIMQPGSSEFESLFGINYWDIVFRGFVDDLWVFDTNLTAGQVASLYAMGNPNVTSVAPETIEGEPASQAVTTTGTVVGTEDFETGFWTAFSDGWAVPTGETVSKTFVNWHDAELAANWNNFFVVLQSEAVSPLEKSEACVEYAVLRADNWGWKMEGETQLNTGDNIEQLGWTVESDWVWETFVADLQGATVTVSVTNNGDTADVECQITTAAGATHFQNYKNIAVDGDVAFSLGVDHALIDIQD